MFYRCNGAERAWRDIFRRKGLVVEEMRKRNREVLEQKIHNKIMKSI